MLPIAARSSARPCLLPRSPRLSWKPILSRAAVTRKGLRALPSWVKNCGGFLHTANLPLPQGWAWAAPPGQLAGVDTPQELHRTLCAVAHRCAQAARAATAAEAQEALAPLPALLTHALVRHAYYRNLLLAVTKPQAAPNAVLRAFLEVLASEPDSCLARAVLTMARQVLRRRAGPVYLALLEAPALQQDLDVAKLVVEVLSSVSPSGAGEALLAFARKINWGTERGDYGVDAAIVEAMGRLGVFEAIPILLSIVGHSGLGSDAEVALLRLAARDPQALGKQDFQRVWERVMEDGYSEYSPDLLGDQARAVDRACPETRASRRAAPGICLPLPLFAGRQGRRAAAGAAAAARAAARGDCERESASGRSMGGPELGRLQPHRTGNDGRVDERGDQECGRRRLFSGGLAHLDRWAAAPRVARPGDASNCWPIPARFLWCAMGTTCTLSSLPASCGWTTPRSGRRWSSLGRGRRSPWLRLADCSRGVPESVLLRINGLRSSCQLLADCFAFSLVCHGYDLYAQLTAGLLRLDDAAIRRALEQPGPRAALEGVYQVLGGTRPPAVDELRPDSGL